MIRLAHFSDIHLTAPRLDWKLRDWFNKRWPGWLNLKWLGREHRFCEADRVLAALGDELQQRRPDHVIFSGDATALGFEEEIMRTLAMASIPFGFLCVCAALLTY